VDEIPDVEGCTPKSLKETPLNLCELKKLNEEVRDPRMKALITSLLELCRISKQATRPEFSEDMGEQLMDSNPALPCLLAAFSSGDADYWLDLGNNADSGQFVLGEPLNRRNRRDRLRLRTVSELFPEAIQQELDEDGQPSCSAAEALERQEPFVNPTLANHALALLARLFRYGTISYHGAFIGFGSIGSVQPLRVDPRIWRRLRKKRKVAKPIPRTITSSLPVPAGSGKPTRQSHQDH
jgi:hypothetical protein